ncbi:hypothetical protein [Streptomyces rimosus]|uniref:hypothetical protein n=1 Tax=Streptomyces rimosus TaxID=1927 RepID=UPI000B2CADA4|nr:hypothetical protein [Streptomyces rimosus]
MSADEIEDALNRKSGLLALSGTSDDSHDSHDLVRSRAVGDERAALALDVFIHHSLPSRNRRDSRIFERSGRPGFHR